MERCEVFSCVALCISCVVASGGCCVACVEGVCRYYVRCVQSVVSHASCDTRTYLVLRLYIAFVVPLGFVASSVCLEASKRPKATWPSWSTQAHSLWMIPKNEWGMYAKACNVSAARVANKCEREHVYGVHATTTTKPLWFVQTCSTLIPAFKGSMLVVYLCALCFVIVIFVAGWPTWNGGMKHLPTAKISFLAPQNKRRRVDVREKERERMPSILGRSFPPWIIFIQVQFCIYISKFFSSKKIIYFSLPFLDVPTFLS